MRYLLLITTLLLGQLALGQQLEFSLKEAQTKALELNRNAQISALEVEKAKRVVKETLAIGLPQINAEGSFQNFLDVPTQVLPDFISPAVYDVLIDENLVPDGSGGTPGFLPAQFGTEYTMSGGASLSQLIFSGSYLIGLQATRTYVEFSRIQQERSEMEVKESVAMAYYTALLAKDNTSILKESESTLQQMLIEVEAMYEVGFVEEQDAQQMRLTLNTLSDQVRNAERQEALTVQLLSYQMGLPISTAIILTDDLSALTKGDDVQSVLSNNEIDLNSHPDLRLNETNVLLSQLRVREQKSRYLPTLNGFFSYSQQAQRNEFNFLESGEDWFPNTVWGVNLSLPIFSSGMKYQRVKQLEIELQEAELNREQAEAGLTLSAIQAKSDYLFAMDSYETAQENLGIARSIRDKTRIKYQEGISSSFELNEMETQYIDAQAKSIQATMSLLNALTSVRKAFNTL
ncbi:MAG: TolC family protein [Flavobacteriales bacterium]|nr:TolC family protein [Flavobacteriales bacterium]